MREYIVTKEFLVYDRRFPDSVKEPFIVKVKFFSKNGDSPVNNKIFEVIHNNKPIEIYQSLFPYFTQQIDSYDFVYKTIISEDGFYPDRFVYRIHNIFDDSDWFISVKSRYRKYEFVANKKSGFRKKTKYLYGQVANSIINDLKTDYASLFEEDSFLNKVLFNPNKFKEDFEKHINARIVKIKFDFFRREMYVKLDNGTDFTLDADLLISGLFRREREKVLWQCKQNNIVEILDIFSHYYRRMRLFLPE